MRKIPPFALNAIPLDEAALELSDTEPSADGVGTRHRLGGKPDHLKEGDFPVCPRCTSKMIFYAQLDTISDKHCLSDNGMVYVFVCFDCNQAAAMIWPQVE